MNAKAQPPGPSAFTTLWTAEQTRRIRRAGLLAKPMSITFGGPHTSAPRFSRAGVRPDDEVFPISVQGGRLLVLCRFRVAELLPVDVFVGRHPDRFDRILDHPEFRGLEPHLDGPFARAFWQLQLWLQANPEVDALCPGEADEVVLTKDASPLRLDAAVPGDAVRALRWQPRNKPARPIKHLSEDGRVERAISLQGVYRLTDASADMLRSVIEQGLGR